MKHTLIAACVLAMAAASGLAQASPAAAGAGLPSTAYTESGSWNGNTAASFFNGGAWNAGDYGTQWIQVDLQQAMTFSSFSYVTDQLPNGVVSQSLYISDSYIGGNYASLTPVASFTGYTINGTTVSLGLTQTTGRYFEIVANGGPSWTALSASNLVAAPVPEPETYAMLLAGLALTGYTARRRKS